MFQKCILQVICLVIAVSSSAVAFGQYQYTPFNPYTSLNGFARNQLTQNYQQATSTGPSLNQIALRNAQQSMQQSYAPPTGMPSASRIGLGNTTSYSGSKPFSGFSQGPAVSPYLNLFRTDLNGNNAFNYNTLVEPQLRQQQLNQQQQQANTQTSYRLQAISAKADYNVEGSKENYPTGHQTVFQYTGHYFPPQRGYQKKRGR